VNKIFKNFSFFKSHLSSRRGFTLIELLVVFTFIGILTALGIAAYSSYNSAQTVQSSAEDVATMLSTAKEHSLSQVIPSSCGSNSVTGYQVDITVTGQQYTLSALCGTKQVITSNSLPPHVMFANGSTPSVLFDISTGTLSSTATLSITGYGKTKTISISQTGNITKN